MLSFEEARARLLALAASPLAVESVPIEQADARVLGEDVVATVDLPGFDYSAMDGYAVRTSDLAIGGAELPVRGESRTGAVPGELAPGATMRIFTGAPVPPGADAVVMQENVTRQGELALFAMTPRIGQNIRQRGSDLVQGATAIAKGTRLRPSHLALAASLDRAELPVTRRPSIAILATGDELRRPGSPSVPGSIPESNTVVLRAIARRAGAVAHALPFVPDDRAATEAAFAAALADADVVVTIGGVSVGDHDLVRPALEAVGVELDFWKVAIKPGKPLAVGRFPRSGAGQRDAIVLGLPGNPASAIVTFTLFGVPLVRTLAGDADPLPVTARARITRAHTREPGRLELLRATLGRDADGRPTVTPFANQASGAVTTMATATAYVVVPADCRGLAEGEDVDVLRMEDLGA